MKITRRQLKKLILEEREKILENCGEPEMHQHDEHQEAADMPCPMSTASQMKAAGATAEDLVDWVSTLLTKFSEVQQSEPQVLVDDGDEFSFTGDVGELPGDEAFGVGYEPGSHGL